MCKTDDILSMSEMSEMSEKRLSVKLNQSFSDYEKHTMEVSHGLEKEIQQIPRRLKEEFDHGHIYIPVNIEEKDKKCRNMPNYSCGFLVYNKRDTEVVCHRFYPQLMELPHLKKVTLHDESSARLEGGFMFQLNTVKIYELTWYKSDHIRLKSRWETKTFEDYVRTDPLNLFPHLEELRVRINIMHCYHEQEVVQSIMESIHYCKSGITKLTIILEELRGMHFGGDLEPLVEFCSKRSIEFERVFEGRECPFEAIARTHKKEKQCNET